MTGYWQQERGEIAKIQKRRGAREVYKACYPLVLGENIDLVYRFEA
jgi:hypothetical protein